MREHQIVITLKPEHLLRIQQMARASGAKSMGIFVRQTLLSALEIEGKAKLAEAQSPAEKRAVANEIRRIHGQLRVFVNESLSSFSSELVDSEITSSELEDLVKLDNSLKKDETFEDEIEAVANRTFAISPRLGSLGEDSLSERFSLTDVSYEAEANGVEIADGDVDLDEVEDEIAGRDPLQELLNDIDESSLIAGDPLEKPDFPQQTVEDPDYDVPLALVERRKQLAKELQEREAEIGLPPSKPQPVKASDAGLERHQRNLFGGQKSERELRDSHADQVDPPEQAPVTTSTNIQEDGTENEDNSFSGGPPPKRPRE